MWYAAHVVLMFEFQDGVQDSFRIWENVYLIDAQTVDDAFAAAKASAALAEEASEGLTEEERPVRLVFKGVRKMMKCEVDESGQIYSGGEATFQQMTFNSAAEIDQYL